MPPPDAVLDPPNLVTQPRSSADSTAADLVDSLMDSLLDLVVEKGDEVKAKRAKKTIRRKKLARKAPELTDDEEEEGKGGEGPERKPACCRGKTLTSSSNLTKDHKKEEMASLAKEELCLDHLLMREYWLKKRVQERKLSRKMSKATQEASSLTDDSADEAELNQGGSVALSNLAKAHVSTLQKEDIPILKQENTPTLMGGASQSLEEILIMLELLGPAIQGHQPPLMLDELTPGLGDCFCEGIVQQCRRPPIKLYLQSRGITINDMMQLKAKVAQFVDANRMIKKMRDLRINFELSQQNLLEYEGLQPRTWEKYWDDMKRSGPWADDTFVQCTAWYLNVKLRIISVRMEETERSRIVVIDGDFSSPPGETRPVMYLGYIVNHHYQSLLPQIEDNSVPQCLTLPVIDNTLRDVVQRLAKQQLISEQGIQVR